MDKDQFIKQQAESQPTSQQIRKDDQELVLSQFADQYHQFLGSTILTKEDMLQFTFQLNQHNILIRKQFLPFSIQPISFNRNNQVIELKVNYGYFILIISILNVDTESKNHEIFNCSFGSFGSVYCRLGLFHQQIAIKCQKFKKDQFEPTLIKVIQEYCIQKIASVLRVGPAIGEHFLFDFLIYKDCIEFMMEKCVPSQVGDLSIMEEDLKQNLRKLHHFNIVHMDIKMQNICFSPTLRRYVFIDYGLSRIISEVKGHKTLTRFRGSLLFCSKEMKECFKTGEERNIDLYYNDCASLIQIFSLLNKIKNIGEKFKPNLLLTSMPIQDIVFHLKYFMYFADILKIRYFNQNYLNRQIQKGHFIFIIYCYQQFHIITVKDIEIINHYLLEDDHQDKQKPRPQGKAPNTDIVAVSPGRVDSIM